MKNLLITTIGQYNHTDSWIKDNRIFDVALTNYDYHEIPSTLCSKVVWLDTFATFKYPGIWQIFKEEPRLLDYEYFFLPDEDIDISCDDINRMFSKMKTMNLDLAQPSIEKSDTSFPSWDIFVNKPDMDVAMVNFVEVMCPVFSRNALFKCLETFNKSQSGWGLDIVWPKLIGDTHNNIAVLHSIVAKHTRKVASGDLYGELKSKMISPSGDRRRLMREYQVKSMDIKEYGYLLSDNNMQ